MAKAAQGVVAIFIDPNGNATASVSDFHTDRFGGMKLAECQEHRARDALARKVVHTYCSELIVKVMANYDCDRLMRALITEQKCKVEIVPVGHDE